MRFRTALALSLLVMISVVLVAAVVVATRILDESARTQIAIDLRRTTAVVEDLQAYRHTLFASEARVVADEPRIKAVVISEETTPATILGVAREMHDVLDSEVFLLTDATGAVTADVLEQLPVGTQLGGVVAVADALARGHGEGLWSHRGDVYQLYAHEITIGDTVSGAAVIGHRLDDRLARTVEKQTGTTVIVTSGSRIIASSTRVSEAALDCVPMQSREPLEIDIDGARMLAISAPFPGAHSDQQLRYVVLRSLDVALQPARRLSRTLYGLLGLSLGLAFVVAVWWARRLSRPIDELVTFTRAIGAGELAHRAPVHGTSELRTLSRSMNSMAGELHASREALAEKARLERELEIAASLQIGLLPKHPVVAGLEIATHMTPSSEVGGDYFDILPADDNGCWIGIGDVAGHGVRAGVVMLMLHSVIATLIEARPHALPRELVVSANRLLYADVRKRLRSDEHITFTLLRWFEDGRIVYAGAHEPIVVCGREGPCRQLPTPGTWLVATPRIEKVTKDTEARLELGDVVVLYSDGITELRDASGEQFGIARMCAVIEAHRSEPAQAIVDAIVAAANQWSRVMHDDVSLVVVRYVGSSDVAT